MKTRNNTSKSVNREFRWVQITDTCQNQILHKVWEEYVYQKDINKQPRKKRGNETTWWILYRIEYRPETT